MVDLEHLADCCRNEERAEEYRDAMREVVKQFPDDLDAAEDAMDELEEIIEQKEEEEDDKNKKKR